MDIRKTGLLISALFLGWLAFILTYTLFMAINLNSLTLGYISCGGIFCLFILLIIFIDAFCF